MVGSANQPYMSKLHLLGVGGDTTDLGCWLLDVGFKVGKWYHSLDTATCCNNGMPTQTKWTGPYSGYYHCSMWLETSSWGWKFSQVKNKFWKWLLVPHSKSCSPRRFKFCIGKLNLGRHRKRFELSFREHACLLIIQNESVGWWNGRPVVNCHIVWITLAQALQIRKQGIHVHTKNTTPEIPLQDKK